MNNDNIFVTIVLYKCGHYFCHKKMWSLYYEEINKYNEFYFLNDKIVLILVMNSYLLWLPLTVLVV
jgi:hypothetical protein